MSDAQKNAPPKGAGCEICQFTGKLLKAASPMFKSYGPEPCPCCYAPPAPAPVAPDVPKDAEARAISAFNLKAADLCISFRIRDDDGRQAMRAALAAYAPVAQGGVITEEQVERLAAIEHEQWMAWASTVAEKEPISDERRARWMSCMVPYSQLSEEMKEHDRVWARKVIAALSPDAKPQSAEVGVITEEQVERAVAAFMEATRQAQLDDKYGERLICGKEAMRAALSAALSQGGGGEDVPTAGPNLVGFCEDALKEWPEGGVDGFQLQEIAEKHGLLIPEQRHTFCTPDDDESGACSCREYCSDADLKTGFTCYRRVKLPKPPAQADGGES